VIHSHASTDASPVAYPFTLKQAASYLGISAKTLYGIVARGEIDHLRTCRGRRDGPAIGGQGRAAGRIKFSREGLEEWIAAHRSRIKETAVGRSTADRLVSPGLETDRIGRRSGRFS
jgi:excisionase family DNA binding protein